MGKVFASHMFSVTFIIRVVNKKRSENPAKKTSIKLTRLYTKISAETLLVF